ncbi:MAG: N-acetylmuramoyl-L-alanine amidase [Nanoarchaeota archaeon]|nr:N-acetylmuramoyl-L-alanine amidase [Nanoarchaeota archaeon]
MKRIIPLLVLLMLASSVVAQETFDPKSKSDEELMDMLSQYPSLLVNEAYVTEIQARIIKNPDFINNNDDFRKAWFDSYGITLAPGEDGNLAKIRSMKEDGTIVTEGTDSTTFNINDHPGATITSTGMLILSDKTEISGGILTMTPLGLNLDGGVIDITNSDNTDIISNGAIIVNGDKEYQSPGPIRVVKQSGSLDISGEFITETEGGKIISDFSGSVRILDGNDKILSANSKLGVYEDGVRKREYHVTDTTHFVGPGSHSGCMAELPCITDDGTSIDVRPIISEISMSVIGEGGKETGEVIFNEDGMKYKGYIMQGKSISLSYQEEGKNGEYEWHKHIINADGTIDRCSNCKNCGSVIMPPEIDTHYMDEHAIPSSNYYSEEQLEKRGLNTDSEFIVVHNTAGSFDGAMNEFTMKGNEKSTHYLVDTDGTIYQLLPDGTKVMTTGFGFAYSKDPNIEVNNFNSINIEVVGYPGKETPEQLKAVEDLVRDIQIRHNIPSEKVYSHREVRCKDDPNYRSKRRPRNKGRLDDDCELMSDKGYDGMYLMDHLNMNPYDSGYINV